MSGFECAQCHEVFGGLAQFDDHQDVNYHRDPNVICRSPVTLGLVQSPGGAWCTPEGAKARESASTRLAAARSRRVPRRHPRVVA